MPEIIPDHVPSPRTLLAWDGTAYRPVRIHTDGTVQVRGEDQLFSIAAALHSRNVTAISGADGWAASASPPDGSYWVVTGGAAADVTTANTEHLYTVRSAPISAGFHVERRAFAIAEYSAWLGKVILEHDDVCQVYFAGGLVGDSCIVDLVGYVMTVE